MRVVVISAACLGALAAVWGVWFGMHRTTLTETDVINAYAAKYVAEGGRAVTDCVAVPGDGAVWIVVRCGRSAAVVEYHADHRGALIERLGPASAGSLADA